MRAQLERSRNSAFKSRYDRSKSRYIIFRIVYSLIFQRAKEGDFVNNEAADGKTHLQNSLTLPTEVLREKKLQVCYYTLLLDHKFKLSTVYSADKGNNLSIIK